MAKTEILVGDCRDVLKTLPDQSVQMCVTSPPYFGLRDYNVDGQIGLESTVEAYVAEMVSVFREVRRVLRDDGVLFLNLGDSYFGSNQTGGTNSKEGSAKRRGRMFSRPARAQRAAAYDTPDTAPANSRGRGCLCGSLCGACRVAYQTGIAHSARQHAPTQAPSPSATNHGHTESASAHPPTSDSEDRADHSSDAIAGLAKNAGHAGEQPHDAQASTSGESSLLLPGECSQTANRGECLLCARSLVDCAQEFAGTTACTCGIGTPLEPSDQSRLGIASSGLAYPDSTIKSPAMALKLKPKDLIGIPWRVALSLQADGWWLRSDCIWSKPNPMPESVRDRPTKAHEYVFLLTKRDRYFYDADAVAEKSSGVGGGGWPDNYARQQPAHGAMRLERPNDNGKRNLRTVWTITPRPFKGAHFATFPPDLAERCIKSGSGEKGACATCGAPWRRIVKRTAMEIEHSARKEQLGVFGQTSTSGKMTKPPTSETIGWEETCRCKSETTTPCIVLDPFAGAGTVGLVANQLGRDSILIELNPEYAAMAEGRIRKEMGGFLAEVERREGRTATAAD